MNPCIILNKTLPLIAENLSGLIFVFVGFLMNVFCILHDLSV
jgi:hypothetical protein